MSNPYERIGDGGFVGYQSGAGFEYFDPIGEDGKPIYGPWPIRKPEDTKDKADE